MAPPQRPSNKIWLSCLHVHWSLKTLGVGIGLMYIQIQVGTSRCLPLGGSFTSSVVALWIMCSYQVVRPQIRV